MSSYDHVLMYEEASLKQHALSVIPVEKIREQAQANYKAYQNSFQSKETTSHSQNEKQQPAFDLNDFLLIELMAWFKNDFFTWTDQPKCVKCQSNQSMTHIAQHQTPTHDEIRWMAGRIEVYQ